MHQSVLADSGHGSESPSDFPAGTGGERRYPGRRTCLCYPACRDAGSAAAGKKGSEECQVMSWELGKEQVYAYALAVGVLIPRNKGLQLSKEVERPADDQLTSSNYITQKAVVTRAEFGLMNITAFRGRGHRDSTFQKNRKSQINNAKLSKSIVGSKPRHSFKELVISLPGNDINAVKCHTRSKFEN